MADTPSQDKAPADRDFKRSTYDFCEKAVARFEANAPASRSFHVTRMQTISGETVQRTYVFTFDLKMTGCELSD